ncbi:hypothetical protein EYF80_030933 [Liparis tanakae]|uniref:Uncharacterized protein n=1 Tax=Liparis tanakae TaxID=230148 RepID=A0A4Z2H038_9TELE|nr:hypothetical protein EYF80_030933 [Liparis tanakae]
MPRLNEARCGFRDALPAAASISCSISCARTSRKSHIWLESQEFATLKTPEVDHRSSPPVQCCMTSASQRGASLSRLRVSVTIH